MRLSRRVTSGRVTSGRAAGVRATYAAVVGERWLWVALAEPGPVGLAGVDLPVEEDDSQPGHHGVRLDLAALPAGEASYDVVSGRVPVSAPWVRAPGAGTTHALERDDDGRLRVLTRAGATGPTLRALRLVGETVAVAVDGATGPLELVADGVVVASVAEADGWWTLAPEHLHGTAGTVLGVRVDGQPVRRRDDDLADPGAGALLPALHPAGAAEPAGRLRWSPTATLVVRVQGTST